MSQQDMDQPAEPRVAWDSDGEAWEEMRAAWLTTGLVGTIVAANMAATVLGLVPVGFGLMVPAGTAFAGLAFVLRDLIHRAGGWRWVVGAIAVGTLASIVAALLTGSPIPGLSAVRIAAASGVAFVVSEMADWAVYSRLRKQSLVAAMLASNTVGAAFDTALFLTTSGFGFAWSAFWGQVLVKALLVSPLAVGALAWLYRRRAGGHVVPR